MQTDTTSRCARGGAAAPAQPRVLGFRRAEKHTLPGGGGVEEPAQRMREREGPAGPRPGRSAARGGRHHLAPAATSGGRERDKGEGGTEVRSRQGREERRRRRRVGADAKPHAREPPSPLPASGGRFNFLAL